MAVARIQRRLIVSHVALALCTLAIARLVEGPSATLVSETLLTALAATALAVAIVALLGRRLAGPVVAMTHAARAMTEGDFDAPLPAPPDDEHGDLIRALASLRGQLRARLAELHADGERLRAVLQGMDEGVALVGEGRIVVANASFARLLDIAPGKDGVEGHTLLEVARVPEISAAIVEAGAKGLVITRELEHGERALVVRATPLADGAQRQVMLALVDVTEARHLERMRRDFVANASHELRTPVAAVLAAAETLESGAGEDPEARARFLAILVRHAQRLARLASDLLDLSRLEAGYRPRVESVSLASALSTVLSTLRVRAEDKKIDIRAQLTPGLPPLAVERAALEQMLGNLLENAVKYTPDGGAVEVTASSGEGTARVTIADTGPGIAAEHLPRLFERFYRVDNARSRELGGTGLGLSIVKHLAIAHGGDVSVESEVGKGSRFTLRLPLR